LADRVQDWNSIGAHKWVFETLLSIKGNCFAELLNAYIVMREDDAWRRDNLKIRHQHHTTCLFLEHWNLLSNKQQISETIRIRSVLSTVSRLISLEISELQAEPDQKDILNRYKQLSTQLS